jgi:hypothetical protein
MASSSHHYENPHIDDDDDDLIDPDDGEFVSLLNSTELNTAPGTSFSSKL